MDIREQARVAADQAAHKAGIKIRDLHQMDELVEAADLFDETWDVGGKSLLPSNLARALTHAGNFCAAAYLDERILGGILGFLGLRDGSAHLHSHVLAVRQSAERHGIGFALKQYQRSWALNHGLADVYWTFDPLVRRNAYFNLCKLGAEIVEYHVNFYGAMDDGLNAGDESDRVMIRWCADSERTVAASEGRSADPDIERLRSDGAQVLLDVNGAGAPAITDRTGRVLLCRVPEDAVSLRRSDPERARIWREALRETMGRALEEGYSATAMSRSGWYVLERAGR